MSQYVLGMEAKLAEDILPSAMSASACKQVIDFPADLKGKKILDIGSGESECVAWLCSQGAYAVGVDVRYDKPGDLEKDTEKSKAEIRHILISCYGKHMGEVHYTELDDKIEIARKNFREHRESSPECYKQSLAGALPFPDGHFDMAFSINCITHGLDQDYRVLCQAVYEAFRTLKKGGELQLYPFFWGDDQEILKNHKYLHGIHKNNSLVEDVPNTTNKRLRIRKPKL